MNRLPSWSFPAFRIAVWIGVFVLGYTMCRRSILMSDEGYLLAQAAAMLDGKVLYRDLDAFVAPGIWLLLAGVFKVFGPSVLITRFLSLACWLATAIVIDRIVTRVASPVHATWALITLGVLGIWAFPAWHFAFYSAWATLFALVALDCVLTWRHSGSTAALLAAGAAAGLSIVFKQNYGVFAAAAVGLTVVVETLRVEPGIGAAAGAVVRRGLLVTAGVVLAVLPVIGYFAWNDALPSLAHSLLVRPFSDFASQHTLPFPPLSALLPSSDFFTGRARLSYEAVPISTTTFPLMLSPEMRMFVDRVHIPVYWAPLLLFLSVAFLLLREARARRSDVDLLACLAMAGLVFLGVWPRADFNHLVNVYQPVIVLGAVAFHRRRWSTPARRWATRVVAMVLSAPYIVLAAMWYVLIVRSMPSELAMSRGGVLLDPWRNAQIMFEVERLRGVTVDGEPVLTIPGLAMLNFLTDRPQPGPYYNLYAVHIAHDGGRSVIEALEKERPRWVIAERLDYFADDIRMRDFAPELIEYLRRNFREAFTINREQEWYLERREEPLPPISRAPLVSSCNATTGGFSTRTWLSGLRFDTIYHRYAGPGSSGERELETVCTFIVPPQSSLAFTVGYRQPDKASEDAAADLRFSIGPWDESEPDRVAWETTMPIEAIESWESPPPTPHRIDLSAWEGRNVRMTIHTTLRGDAEPNPFDLEGFALSIHDLVLESPPREEATGKQTLASGRYRGFTAMAASDTPNGRPTLAASAASPR